MTVLLDTHALIWYASGSDKLSSSAQKFIESAEVVHISAISAWEIGMLVEKGRLSLKYDVNTWIQYCYNLPKIQWVNVNPKIAILSTQLPGQFHGDPADRIIVATAISNGNHLITADRSIQNYQHIRTIW
jgi:PIN domain nuclease of toxin-antitoxin system